MDLLAAWLAYPLALALICLGLGLLAGRAAGWPLPGALLLPAGLVALVALARLLTHEPATAGLALPVVGALALAGLALERRRLRRLRPDPWMAGAAVGVFAVFAAPVVLSGAATLAGYLALPDTSHQLALAWLLPEHGFSLDALPDGSTRRGLTPYLLSGYPAAGQAALGVTAPLGIVDLAWLYQPWLSFAAAIAALALGALAAPVLRHRWQAGVATFVAGQPALVLGFALQGSIKELTALAALTTAVALLARALSERRPARALVVVAVAAAAAIGALGPAAAAFLALPALVAAAWWGARALRRRGAVARARELAWLVAAGALAALLALPVLESLGTQLLVQGGTLQAGAEAVTGAGEDLGNLAGALEPGQVLGIWLSGDYRYLTEELGDQQGVLLWFAGACALAGLAWALRRRAWPPLLLAASFALPSAWLLDRGSAYADAKVLALLSPSVVLLVALGAVVPWRGRWRALSAAATALLVVAVLWSSALAYHDVSLMPRERYAELARVDELLAGRGPVLSNEYDRFAKYFLRHGPVLSEPEWPHPFRAEPYEPNALLDPRRRPYLETPLDVDDLPVDYLQAVPWVLLRRSPAATRPPASFALAWSGEHYELWRRERSPRVLSHLPLGRDHHTPEGPLRERDARRLARRARARGARLAFVERERMIRLRPTQAALPGRWFPTALFPGAVVTAGPGRQVLSFRVRRAGRYRIWVEGSFARPVRLLVDGRPVPRPPAGLDSPGAYHDLGAVRLRRGRHELRIEQGGGDLRPGSGGYRASLRHLGPVVFDPVANEDPPLRTVAAGDWRRLVGRRLDWLEVVRRPRS